MKKNDRNLRRKRLRRLSMALAVAMMTSALPVAALAEEVRDEDTEIIEKSEHHASEEDEQAEAEPEPEEEPEDDSQAEPREYSGEESEEEPEAPAAQEPSEEEEPSDEEREEEQPSEEKPAEEQPSEEKEEKHYEDGAVVITGFMELDKTEYKLAQKPELELVQQNLPTEVTAYIAGLGEEGVPFNVEWVCENYDEAQYGTFVFTANFTDEIVRIQDRDVNVVDIQFDKAENTAENENEEALVAMPQISVIVLAVSGFEPLESDQFVLPEKPETVKAAVKQMKLPKTVRGTLSDSEEPLEFPVKWTCENYDEDAGEYVFTAEFSKAAYPLMEGVEMPRVTMTLETIEQVEEVEEGEEIMEAAIQTIVRIDPPKETEYVYTVKPESILDELPAQLTGEVQEQVEDTQIDVTWSCEDYGEREEGVFLFTAACDPEKYTYDETMVTMPTVTVTVGREFELSDNVDGTKTIEKWNRPGETLVIPAKIDGKAVTAVREGAFTEAATLTSVTMTDTIRSVPANAFGELVHPTTVKLIVTDDTRMESGDSFYHMLADKETVALPWAVTDFDVRTGGSLSLECDTIISAEHQMEVEKGALVILNENNELTNNGAITNEGTMIFEGMLLNNGALLNVDQGTVSKKLFFEPKSASYSISKDYDDKQIQYLDAADFRIVNLEAGESINISEVEADYGSAKAGDYDAVAITFSVQYVLAPEGYTYGELENITCPGTIKPRSITSNNNITIADISDQTWTGKAITPKVTVRDKDLSNRILTEGKQSDTGNDYYLTYEKNTDEGTNTAKVVVHGVNNYTGTKEKTFTIKKDDTKETKYVTIRLKGEKPHKIYDSTVNLNWKEKVNGETVEHKYVFSEWFTINGLESGDTFSLETFKGQYDSADAGTKHTITFTFTPKSTQPSSNKYNYVLKDSDKTLKVTGCTIEPKVLTITPSPVSKVYGTNDPYITPKSASGMMETDKEKYKAGTLKFEGRMTYEGGDDVGEHKIVPGTLKLGDNYTIAVAEAYMTITAKSIADTDVTVTIGNQKYTGSAVTPDITVEYGTRTLSKGKDYEVSFSNNTEAGLATATLRGIGNYTGEKTHQFRILKTSDGSISGSTSSSSSSYSTTSSIASMYGGTPEGDSDTGAETTSSYMKYDGGDGSQVMISQTERVVYLTYQGKNYKGTYSGSLTDGVNVNIPGTDITLYIKTFEDSSRNPVIQINNRAVLMTRDESADVQTLIQNFVVENEAEADEAIAEEEAESLLGAMVIEGDNLGQVLYGEDNEPRGFDLFEEEIQLVSENPDGTVSEVNLAADITAEPIEPEQETAKMRLLIQPYSMKDENGDTVYLDAEETREKYEPLHLRLTNEQIQALKDRGFLELVYELEYAQLRLPLEALTPEIDLRNFPELMEPEQETAPDETMEAPEDEPLSETDDGEVVSEPVEDAAAEAAEFDVGPIMKPVNMYDIFIGQTDETSLSEREKAALEGKYTLTALYRVEVNAVDGEFPAAAPAGEGLATAAPLTAEPAVEPTLYPILKALNPVVAEVEPETEIEENAETEPETEIEENVEDEAEVEENFEDEDKAEVEENSGEEPGTEATMAPEENSEAEDAEAGPEAEEESLLDKSIADAWTKGYAQLRMETLEAMDTLPKDAKELYVSPDETLPDEEAVRLSEPSYVVDIVESYAEFYPSASGLYGLVAPVVTEEEPDEEFVEPETSGEPLEEATDEPTDEPAASPTAEVTATPTVEVTATPTVAPTEEPVPDVIQDPDPKYAYCWRSKSGNMYWLVDTVAKTVEFYRADSKTYRIGDYTGSLMSGLTVQFRDNSEMVEIRLKYPQTYRFALTSVDANDMLMEQDDVANVEETLNGVR